jgi:hypothetical protein
MGILLFGCGLAVGVLKVFPYRQLESLAAAGKHLAEYPLQALRIKPQEFLVPLPQVPQVPAGTAAQAYAGSTFMTGFFGDNPGVWLVDMQGNTVHEWRVPFNSVWPEARHLEKQPSNWGIDLMGAVLYPNGDVVFSFQFGGLVRVDKCSRVLWRLPEQTHHAVHRDVNGHLWVPSRKLHETASKEFPNIPAPFFEEFVLEISGDGKILRELSILDAVYRSNYEGVLFANGAHASRVSLPLDHDFTHLNDVDVLTPQLATAFPLFEAGDVMVSLRNVNLVLVIDPATRRIKWSKTGPFLRQHDPDFMPNGRISVFDNRSDGSEPGAFGTSRIVETDPNNGWSVTTYGDRPDERFYTEKMGDHQLLPNGNTLITATLAGWVFEVTPERKIVWSYVNRWRDDSAAWISSATRYPLEFLAQVQQGDCP